MAEPHECDWDRCLAWTAGSPGRSKACVLYAAVHFRYGTMWVIGYHYSRCAAEEAAREAGPTGRVGLFWII